MQNRIHTNYFISLQYSQCCFPLNEMRIYITRVKPIPITKDTITKYLTNTYVKRYYLYNTSTYTKICHLGTPCHQRTVLKMVSCLPHVEESVIKEPSTCEVGTLFLDIEVSLEDRYSGSYNEGATHMTLYINVKIQIGPQYF